MKPRISRILANKDYAFAQMRGSFESKEQAVWSRRLALVFGACFVGTSRPNACPLPWREGE